MTAKPLIDPSDLYNWLEKWLPAYHNSAELAASPLTQLQAIQDHPAPHPGKSVQMLIDYAIDTLKPPEHATGPGSARTYQLLHAYYRQQKTARLVYEDDLHIGRSHFFRERKRALNQLAVTLWQLERDALSDHGWQTNLPPPSYDQLFGVAPIVDGLINRLADSDTPTLIAVDGMGGIGKTAVARATAAQVMESGLLQRLSWQTAQQSVLVRGEIRTIDQPALTADVLLNGIARDFGQSQWKGLPSAEKERRIQQCLHQTPSLLVVDNLETAADMHALVDILWRLVGETPSRVLLTTRHRVERLATLFSWHLPSLSQSDAFAFARHLATHSNDVSLDPQDEDSLQTVFAVTGGHPLAIKLIVGQATIMPLHHILTDYRAIGTLSDPMYVFIYERSWQLLSEQARELLLTMPHLAPLGATWDELSAISDMAPHALDTALRELIRFSLVQVKGKTVKLYSLHPLTRQFVVNRLLPDSAESPPILTPAEQQQFTAKANRAGQWAIRNTQSGFSVAQLSDRRRSALLQSLASLLRYTEHTDAQSQLTLQMHWPMLRGAQWSEWEPFLHAALRIARKHDDKHAEFQLRLALGDVYALQGDNTKAIPHLRAAISLEQYGAEDWFLPYSRLAECLLTIGQVQEARMLHETTLASAEKRNDDRATLIMLGQLGRAYMPSGAWQPAIEAFAHALSIARERNHRAQMLSNLNFLGMCYAQLNDQRASLTHYEEALELCRELGEKSGEGVVLGGIGRLALQHGKLADAEDALQAALDIQRQVQNPAKLAVALKDMARLKLRQDETQLAGQYLSEAEPLAEHTGSDVVIGLVVWARGMCEKAMACHVAARSTFSRSKMCFERAGYSYYATQVSAEMREVST